MQVNPSKREKKKKPSQAPVMIEPALDMSAPDSSTHKPPPEPASDIPVPTSDSPAEDTLNSSNNPEASSPVKTNDPKVEILKS